VAEIIETNGLTIEAVAFRRALMAWGREHFRPFPWRFTEDPYRILMAEVMLHRTQASQVVPVYKQVVERYPDMSALARATKEELHRALYPLGLRWRIALVHDMAADLVARFSGQVPREKADLLSLPGVSEYIASAVLCFAWNQPQPLIDTNTVRVVGRLFGLEVKDSSRRTRHFRTLIGALLDPHEPRNYNYALLDLAERVCTKKRPPECASCPVLKECVYGNKVLRSGVSAEWGRDPDG
jgi:A/G-specific adenine glycosylase